MNLKTVAPLKDEVVATSELIADPKQTTPVVLTPEAPKQAPVKSPTPSARKAAPKVKAATPVVAAEKVVEKPSPKTSPKTPAQPKKRAAKVPQKVEATAVVPAAPEKTVKSKKPVIRKPKLVRDSFTIPENDYGLFATLKQRALAAGVEVKKGELLRAGLRLLAKQNEGDFVNEVGLVERIKAGRPKK